MNPQTSTYNIYGFHTLFHLSDHRENNPSPFSEQIMASLHKYSSYWVNTSNKPAKVIIPLIFYYDSEGGFKKSYLPLHVSRNKGELRNGFVTQPIVFVNYLSLKVK